MSMRKIIVLTFITLDGVMQAPGGPEEDANGNFKYGGWSFPYWDDSLAQVMGEQMGKPFALLLGRKTYEIFAAHWPKQTDAVAAQLNNATKYVVSKTLNNADWKNTVIVKGDAVKEIKELKLQDGPDLQVHGSANMIQTLLKNDLVDEFWLKIYPLVLGNGKRLFAEGTIPANLRLVYSKVTPKGVIVANYQRAGEVKIGSFADNAH
ncbi:MAG TPA: dihydrofolate reductase family protein [Candidatus Acidoferrales bacterium]|nr:dihydrofolate reductase family protein [Candidatus Acidoferrales bacterium]